MKVRHILPDLLMLTDGGINMYALQTNDGTILVDCGTEAMGPTILQHVVSQDPLLGIIVTHAHYDHAGGAALVAKETGAPVWMHETDAALVADGRWKRPARHAGTPLSWLLNRQVVEKAPATIPKLQVTHRLNGNQQIALANGIEAHEMPGHSAGQIALTWENRDGRRVLFAADTCMNVFGLTQPIIYESASDGRASIATLADLSEQADLMVFGHGRPLKNPYGKMRRFAQRVG
ncbi:MAG: MBL fold metallo-hydrolase [Pseudomonadota bacterium]